MAPQVILILGVALGVAIAGMLGWGWLSWREGDKLGQRPSQVTKENREKLQKAKEEAAKGRRKQAEGALAFVAAFLLLFLTILFIVAS